jgi:hypothetical protein
MEGMDAAAAAAADEEHEEDTIFDASVLKTHMRYKLIQMLDHVSWNLCI